MYWIGTLATGCFLTLLCLSHKEDAAEDVAYVLKPFYRMSLYLYKRIYPRYPGLFVSSQVEKDLLSLHPGESGEYLKMEYYAKKMAICLAVLWAGTLFGMAAKLSAQSGMILEDNGVVWRGDFREGSREVNLAMKYGRHRMDFRVQVEPRQLSEEEIEEVFDAFLEKLPEYILGENEDLEHVASDLNLEENYEDYPISVEWESHRPNLLGNDGHLFFVGQVESALLSVCLHYGEYDRQSEIAIILMPPELTEEERLYMEMEDLLLQSQKDSLEQEGWALPSEWKGENIRWKQVIEDNGLLLWVVSIGTALLVYLFKDRDLHGQLEKRKRILRREYPEILHKLVLFVGAGMTIRGAFQKIATDYEAKQKRGGKNSPACEEIRYTCRELLSGISEGKSYEHFGRRTGLQEYIRLSTLLMQNLKRGNVTLLERLREEADKASEEQLQQGRKAGEEAGTKLLVPMAMMLAVVMAVIMIPAFSSL